MSPKLVVLRSIIYILAAALSISVLVIGLVEVIYVFQIQPLLKVNLALQEKYLARFSEDLTFIHRNEVFSTLPATGSDAGAFLNGKVFWAPVKASLSRTNNQPLVSLTVREALLRFRGDWIRKFDQSKKLDGNLSIFTGLSRFDHWDIETESPIDEIKSRHEFVPPPQLPLPDSSDLLAAAKLRLMKGALSGELIPALNDVRQLARLLLTTENSQLILTGLVLYDYERHAYEFFVEERNLDPKAWIPVDRSITRRTHRVISATRNYLHVWTPAKLIDSVFLNPDYTDSAVEICSAVNESFPLELSMRARLEPQWPFELSFRAQYQQFDRILKLARSHCRLRYIGDLIDHHQLYHALPGPLILSRLPYARKIFGLNTSVRKFNGFASYEMGDN